MYSKTGKQSFEESKNNMQSVQSAQKYIIIYDIRWDVIKLVPCTEKGLIRLTGISKHFWTFLLTLRLNLSYVIGIFVFKVHLLTNVWFCLETFKKS